MYNQNIRIMENKEVTTALLGLLTDFANSVDLLPLVKAEISITEGLGEMSESARDSKPRFDAPPRPHPSLPSLPLSHPDTVSHFVYDSHSLTACNVWNLECVLNFICF